MLRSSNPVLSRQDAFTPGQGQYAPGQFNQGQYHQGQYHQGQYGQPHGYDQYQQNPYQQPQQPQGAVMTFDDVVTKTGITLGVVILTAALAFFLLPEALLFPAAIGASLATIVITFIVAFRRTVPAGLVLLFAAFEGVMVGGLSKVFEIFYPGIVVQAVFGTFVAAALTLGAYKFFNIRVTPKFTKIVAIATLAFFIATLANFALSFAGINMGLRAGVTGSVSMLAIGVSAIAVVLAVLNLVLDFDYIEKGVQMGAPASQSWKAAFGLTVTLVWLYVEMLRILSYFRR